MWCVPAATVSATHPCGRKTMALRTIVDPDQLDAHNHYRIRSMSEVALRRRIWKIRREDKMVSFIKVCELRVLLTEHAAALNLQPKYRMKTCAPRPPSQVLLDCSEPELAAEAEYALAALRGEPVKPPPSQE
ncbi:hypothetical protein H632_c407p1 [Helicosporidium sp. ATCC 50920]|nr:hypothetical protein H632_c407p1 [Helicosporidium sp. ATCC 50920]|eukprot:KDD75986.1 hypothetical protein H632_c407p1 [Helicosporidium sp. ATCC 50920]